MNRKKILFHTKGRPSIKDLVLAEGLNDEGKTVMDICPVSSINGICSSVVTKIKRWARTEDVRSALKDYEKYCCWNKYPENKPRSKDVWEWFIIACQTDKPWRQEKYIYDTEIWDGKKFGLNDSRVVYWRPILPVPQQTEHSLCRKH